MAKELEITNGHAARMRFSRFRQHMEGSATMSRKRVSPSSEPKTKRTKSTKSDEKQSKAERTSKREAASNDIKADPRVNSLRSMSTSSRVKPEPVVKSEPGDFGMLGFSEDGGRASQVGLLVPKQEVKVKAEPGEGTTAESIAFERLIDPALCDYGSPKPLTPEKRVKKEERPRPTFTFSQYMSPRAERQTSHPGLPFLEILPTSEGM